MPGNGDIMVHGGTVPAHTHTQTHTHILVGFQAGKKLNTCVQSAVLTKNPDSFTLHNSEV